METEELPHSLTPPAPSFHPPLTRGEVADQELKPVTRGESAARPLLPVINLNVVGPNDGAPFRAYVLQALHRLTQLRVQSLLLPMPPRFPFPL